MMKSISQEKQFLEIDYAIRREDFEFLQEYYVKASSKDEIRRVKLSKDPRLNIMIAYERMDDILLKLINMMTSDALEATNKVGDMALQVVAVKDRVAQRESHF